MKIIADIADTIENLLDNAEDQIEYAILIKEEYPNIAQSYYKTSLSLMNSIDEFHAQIVTLITEYRKEHGDPPERMMGRYEYIHEKQIKKANKIKILQGLFK